jgi:hypothetical protein
MSYNQLRFTMRRSVKRKWDEGTARPSAPAAGRGTVIAFPAWHRRDRDAARVIGLVAGVHAVPPMLMLHGSRCTAEVATARQVAMYLMHIVLRRSMSAVGRYFGRDRTTVAYACARIEDRRDDRCFDEALARLEAAVDRAAGKPSEETHHAAR